MTSNNLKSNNVHTKFPSSFVWGAASSAYQTEGYSTADGGGYSVWDMFCHSPNNIADGDSGDIACDGYHRYEEDIHLASEIGVRAYRFSISWSRVDPNGDGNWNVKGLEYYKRIVQCCLDHKVEPYVTLHHWELPQKLEDQGGWLNENTPIAFARFAEYIALNLGDKVHKFITLNEPQCIIKLGYGDGIHAPGRHLDIDGQFSCWKHLVLAHGLSAKAIRKCNPSIEIGIASTGRLCYPVTDSPKDFQASEIATFELLDDDWVFTHSMLFDPICLGHFPPCSGVYLAHLATTISDEEWKIIHTVPDFIGVNVYNGWGVRMNEQGNPEYVTRDVGHPRTALKWPITERVMREGMIHLYHRYHLPIYITENGLSCNDKLYLDGSVHDLDRIDFLNRYLSELALATKEADIRGYFHWSLTDNFEWHSGYSERFGLIYIDYPTQRRILKDSAYWYGTVIKTNGASL